MILKKASPSSPLREATETEKAYLAGLVDGEGTITIHKKSYTLDER
jgi:hypothetical protein